MKTIEEIELQIKDLLKEVESLKKQEPKFEVGKWYKNKFGEVVNYQTNNPYGVNSMGQWYCNNDWEFKESSGYIPATPQEVETALIAEAKKRGFKEGVKIDKRKLSSYRDGAFKEFEVAILGGSNFVYRPYEDALVLEKNSSDLKRNYVYQQGVWATIIDDKIEIGGYEVKICQTQDPQYNGSGKCSYIPTVKYTSIDGNTFSKTFWESAKYVSEHNKAKIMVGCSKQFDVSLETINKILAKL